MECSIFERWNTWKNKIKYGMILVVLWRWLRMKRVAEIMYVVESERQAFLDGALNLNEEEQKMLWLCGVRKQQYFALNDLIFMTFEYKGHDFENDMNKLTAYLDSKNKLIKTRRKDVAVDELSTTSWWAPVKRLGSVLDAKPEFEDDIDSYMSVLDGGMSQMEEKSNTSFDEDDWTESIHI